MRIQPVKTYSKLLIFVRMVEMQFCQSPESIVNLRRRKISILGPILLEGRDFSRKVVGALGFRNTGLCAVRAAMHEKVQTTSSPSRMSPVIVTFLLTRKCSRTTQARCLKCSMYENGKGTVRLCSTYGGGLVLAVFIGDSQ